MDRPLIYYFFLNGLPLLELYFSAIIFTGSFEKRRRWPLLFTGCVIGSYALLIAAISLVFSLHADAFMSSDSQLSGPMLVQLFMQLTLVLTVRICYLVPWSTVLILDLLGVSAMMVGKYLFYLAVNVLNLPWHNDTYFLLYYCVRSVSVVICSLVIWYLMGRRIRFLKPEKRQVPLLAAMFLLSQVFIICSIVRDELSEMRHVLFWFDLLIFSISLLLLAVANSILQNRQLEREMAMMKAIWHQQAQQMLAFQESIDIINVKYHDLKYRIAAASAGDSAWDEEAMASLNVYDSKLSVGNKTLDTVLTQYRLNCEQKKIRLTCIADASQLDFMSVTDICVLFGNALDNAIEAVEGLPEEQRLISLHISNTHGLVSIRITNTCLHPVVFKDSIPQTMKINKHYHGFGTQSMRLITDKYHGDIRFSQKEDTFSVSILLPIVSKENG